MDIEDASIFKLGMCELVEDETKSYIFWDGFGKDDYEVWPRRNCFACDTYHMRLYECRKCRYFFCQKCCKFIKEKLYDINHEKKEIYRLHKYYSFICNRHHNKEYF